MKVNFKEVGDMEFSENLRNIMIQKGVTQSQLAKLTDIPQPTISQYISGGRPGSPENMIKLANVLDVSLDQLFGRASFSQVSVPRDEDEILKIFRNLNANGKSTLLSIGKALLYDPENTRILYDD